jgi:hypothetical protein
VKRPAVPVLVFAAFFVACGDTAHRPIPAGPRAPGLAAPPPVTAPPPSSPAEPLERLEAEGRPPLLLTAVAVEGHPPLPTYHATVRNVSNRPVRRALVTVVYLDEEGRALPGENHEVEFGSPLKAIDPGVTLETPFLSRVERAPGVRLVLREVTFLEKGPGAELVPREWKNPRYEADLAALHGAPPLAPP